MPTPSLILVPARFKTGKLYTPVATTSGGTVLGASGDFNVIRATNATRVNASGLIESVASGIPRLDYPLGGGCPALLVENAATNLALQSRDLSQGVWVKTNVTAVKNAVGADGVASGATTLTATAASGTVLQAIVNVSQSRVFSAYVRRVTGTGAVEMTTNGGTNWTAVTISSTYTQVACAAQTILNGSVGFRMAVSGDVIEVDFTQSEVGPAFTSPIPTTAGTGSRSADVISVSGAVSGCIGQTEGTLYWEGNALINGAQDIFFLNRTTANAVTIYKNSQNFLRLDIFANNASAVQITNTVAVTGFLKLAAAYKSGDTTFYINGQKIGSTNTNALTFTGALNSIVFAHAALLTNGGGNQQCRAVALYTTRLSDSELAALTTL